MKAYGKWMYQSTFFHRCNSWRWVLNFTPRLLYPLGKSPRYMLNRRLLFCWESNPGRRYKDCGVPAPSTSQILLYWWRRSKADLALQLTRSFIMSSVAPQHIVKPCSFRSSCFPCFRRTIGTHKWVCWVCIRGCVVPRVFLIFGERKPQNLRISGNKEPDKPTILLY
jgi:hypothetical protein